jgi:hypothetical protein
MGPLEPLYAFISSSTALIIDKYIPGPAKKILAKLGNELWDSLFELPKAHQVRLILATVINLFEVNVLLGSSTPLLEYILDLLSSQWSGTSDYEGLTAVAAKAIVGSGMPPSSK